MRFEIPKTIEKDIFENEILKKLNYQVFKNLGYKDIIQNNYSYNMESGNYIINEEIDEEITIEIDFILKRIDFLQFKSLRDLSIYLRKLLDHKKFILLFAYNGTGKTRLSTEFKNLGKKRVINESATISGDDTNPEDDENIDNVSEETTADTLYYNAFTEDLFYWDNDLENDTERVLKLNQESRFFNGLETLEMENRIRPFLSRYADFDFFINYEEWSISFYRELRIENEDRMETEGDVRTERINYIKVSRGEENIFLWCFFLAVAQLAIDGQETYDWVKYIYIDDPISSLDDNNSIAVASHLSSLIKKQDQIKIIISTHHTLFFNVMYNELGNAEKFFLTKIKENEGYSIIDTRDTPFFHHVALLKELYEVAESGKLYTYHFNILRNILEKTASFHGFSSFSSCIKEDSDDLDGTIHARLVNLLSHGNYSLFEPKEMLPENKDHFKKILKDFMENYRFNPELFPEIRT